MSRSSKMDGAKMSREDKLWQEENALAGKLKSLIRTYETSNESGYREYVGKQAVFLRDLGCHYQGKAKGSEQLEDLAKASALFNAALVRAQRATQYSESESLSRLQNELLKDLYDTWCDACRMGQCSVMSYDNWSKERDQNKEFLTNVRDGVRVNCQKIEKLWEQWQIDGDNIIPDIVLRTRQMAECVTQYMKTLYVRLLQQCIATLGESPSSYCVVGMGSLSRDEATPYSDLEFAILIEDLPEREAAPLKAYLRTLTHFFHLKVLDFGETILPSMAIESLNDFYKMKDGDNNWFYDDITPSGLKFDAALPWACKTPLGRPQKGVIRKESVELIGSATELSRFLSQDSILKQGYHLADILSCTTHIFGEEKLARDFEQKTIESISCQKDEFIQSNMNAMKKEFPDLSEFLVQNKNGEVAKVKHNIYRLPSVLVSHWRSIYNIQRAAKSPWAITDNLESSRVLNELDAHRVKLLVSIVYTLRLSTYLANGAQREVISFFPSINSDLSGKAMVEHHIRSQKIPLAMMYILAGVMHYFQLHYMYRSLAHPAPSVDFQFQEFHAKYLSYACEMLGLNKSGLELQIQASKIYGRRLAEVALVTDTSGSEAVESLKVIELKSIGEKSLKAGNPEMALASFDKALDLRTGQRIGFDRGMKVKLLQGRATSLMTMGKYETALDSLQQITDADKEASVEICCQISLCYCGMKQYEKALKLQNQCLQSITSKDNALLQAKVLTTTARVHGLMNEYEKACDHCNEALRINRTCYGEQTCHPAIADLCRLKGAFKLAMKQFDVARACFTEAKVILLGFYGTNANIDVTRTLISIADTYLVTGDMEAALPLLQEARDILQKHFPAEYHRDYKEVTQRLGLVHPFSGFYTSLFDCVHVDDRDPDDSEDTMSFLHQLSEMHFGAEETIVHHLFEELSQLQRNISPKATVESVLQVFRNSKSEQSDTNKRDEGLLGLSPPKNLFNWSRKSDWPQRVDMDYSNLSNTLYDFKDLGIVDKEESLPATSDDDGDAHDIVDSNPEPADCQSFQSVFDRRYLYLRSQLYSGLESLEKILQEMAKHEKRLLDGTTLEQYKSVLAAIDINICTECHLFAWFIYSMYNDGEKAKIYYSRLQERGQCFAPVNSVDAHTEQTIVTDALHRHIHETGNQSQKPSGDVVDNDIMTLDPGDDSSQVNLKSQCIKSCRMLQIKLEHLKGLLDQVQCLIIMMSAERYLKNYDSLEPSVQLPLARCHALLGSAFVDNGDTDKALNHLLSANRQIEVTKDNAHEIVEVYSFIAHRLCTIDKLELARDLAHDNIDRLKADIPNPNERTCLIPLLELCVEMNMTLLKYADVKVCFSELQLYAAKSTSTEDRDEEAAAAFYAGHVYLWEGQHPKAYECFQLCIEHRQSTEKLINKEMRAIALIRLSDMSETIQQKMACLQSSINILEQLKSEINSCNMTRTLFYINTCALRLVECYAMSGNVRQSCYYCLKAHLSITQIPDYATPEEIGSNMHDLVMVGYESGLLTLNECLTLGLKALSMLRLAFNKTPSDELHEGVVITQETVHKTCALIKLQNLRAIMYPGIIVSSVDSFVRHFEGITASL